MMDSHTSLQMIFQDHVLRGGDPRQSVMAAGVGCHIVETDTRWQDELLRLDARFSPVGSGPSPRLMLFGSWQLTSFVLRRCPNLARGVYRDSDDLLAHIWMSMLPGDLLLNDAAIFLPFGKIVSQEQVLKAKMGPEIFIRPVSGAKTFAGRTVPITDLAQEISAIRQIDHIGDDEVVMIDRARRIDSLEWRFWIHKGVPVGAAPYRHDGVVSHREALCPDSVVAAAADVGRRLASRPASFVADFSTTDGRNPKLIEINGFSTSGFYPGFDFHSFARAIKDSEAVRP